MDNKTAETEQALAAYERGITALEQKDFDTAVWELFKASRLGFSEKKYHQAFADALLKRGLKPLEKKDEARAEELYNMGNNCRELKRLDMWLEAVLLGHLDSAEKLRVEFIIAAMTKDEGKALTELLIKANYPKALYDTGINYWYGMSGYPKDGKKALEYLQKAADHGCEQSAQTIKNYIKSDKEDKERVMAEKEFAKQNPPLKGAEKKKCEDELAGLMHHISRKTSIIKIEESKAPPPMKQILTSHIGGYPYFEEDDLLHQVRSWPCHFDKKSDRKIIRHYDFIFQVFQDENNSVALPKGVQLLQLFYDWEDEAEHIILHGKLQKEKATTVKNPFGRSLKYKAITFETANMIPAYNDVKNPDIINTAEKIHPGKGWNAYNQLADSLGFKQPVLGSYLGGYMAEFIDYQGSYSVSKSFQPLFQLYLEDNGFCPFGWKGIYDALLYASFNAKAKNASAFLRQNFD